MILLSAISLQRWHSWGNFLSRNYLSYADKEKRLNLKTLPDLRFTIDLKSIGSSPAVSYTLHKSAQIPKMIWHGSHYQGIRTFETSFILRSSCCQLDTLRYFATHLLIGLRNFSVSVITWLQIQPYRFWILPSLMEKERKS